MPRSGAEKSGLPSAPSHPHGAETLPPPRPAEDAGTLVMAAPTSVGWAVHVQRSKAIVPTRNSSTQQMAQREPCHCPRGSALWPPGEKSSHEAAALSGKQKQQQEDAEFV